MITLCSVIPDSPHYNGFVKVMLESMVKYTRKVTDVLLAVPLPKSELTEIQTIKKWTERGINFHQFHCPCPDIWFGHAEGLHRCIDLATTSHLLFCDPDLFFYSAADELYLSLMEEYELQYIGCSHHSAVVNAYSFFPYVVNSLVKKESLPPSNWLEGLLKYRGGQLYVTPNTDTIDNYPLAPGKYLLPSPVPGHWQKLPNIKPEILFDTSVNLCMWGLEQKWRWLSFQTIDTHNYSTKYYRGNVKLTKKLAPQKLIHHCVRTTPEQLEAEYKKFLDEEKNSDSL